jgi:hypothetical protein
MMAQIYFPNSAHAHIIMCAKKEGIKENELLLKALKFYLKNKDKKEISSKATAEEILEKQKEILALLEKK